MRPIAVTVSVIALISSGGVAHAAGEQRKECIVAADEGQTLRDQGKLGAARERFLACAASRCPSIVSKQCTAWVEETDAAIPTVLFRVRKDTGAEILDARILVDGQPLPAAALAHALPFDPGVHVVRVERNGAESEQSVVVRPREKSRVIELVLKSEAPPPPPPATPIARPPTPEPVRFRVPLLGWIGVGVGVAEGATTAVFAVLANDDASHLRSTCAPSCAESERDGVETKVTMANVGLGVGIFGLGLAVVTTLLANTAPTKAATPVARSGLRLDVAPGGIRGVF